MRMRMRTMRMRMRMRMRDVNLGTEATQPATTSCTGMVLHCTRLAQAYEFWCDTLRTATIAVTW
jgi:hypothetical protein